MPTVAPPIDHDLPCVSCGYNLRTLGRAALCPECATPVARSLSPNPMAQASAAKLRLVRVGLYLMVIASALAVMLSAIAYPHFSWLGWVGVAPGGNKVWLLLNFTIDRPRDPRWVRAMAVVTVIVHVTANWLAATRFTQPPQTAGVNQWRRWVRSLLVLMVVLGIGALTGDDDALVSAFFAVTTDVAQVFVFLAYLAALARFARYVDLARDFSRCNICLGLALGCLLLASPLAHSELLSCFARIACGVLLFPAALWALVGILRLGARLGTIRTLYS